MNRPQKGFTIVEIIIVIVVIGILASLVTLSYTGINRQAAVLSVQSDLKNASDILEIDRTNSDNDKYPAITDDANSGLGLSQSTGTTYNYYATSNYYCLEATSTAAGSTYHISSNSPAIIEGVCGPIVASSFVNAWGGGGYDNGYVLVATDDDGYAIVGNTGSYGAGGFDSFLTKYSSDGSLSWSKTLGGGTTEYGKSLVQTSDGGYAVTGYTNSYGAGLYDLFLSKYTSDGTLSWTKTWGSSSNTDMGYALTQTSDGGYAVTGLTYSYGAIGDMFLVKYTSDGTMSWNKTWGGTAYEYGNSVVQTSDGGYAVTGKTRSYGAGAGKTDAFLAKYTSGGTLSWSKTWGGTGDEVGNAVVQTSDGGYMVIGSTDSYGAGGDDSVLIKYDSSGNLSWAKTWGGSGDDVGNSVVQNSNNTYAITGSTTSYGAGSIDMFIAKYASDGTLSWGKTWGGSGDDLGNSIVKTNDSGYAVTGRTASYGSGRSDMLLAKYTGDGKIIGCSSAMCRAPSATITSPSATITSPSATVTTPSAILNSPSPTVNSPSATSTVIVSP
jgi:prepilin-type N-terminal cleavage/methylation domain-containing protein